MDQLNSQHDDDAGDATFTKRFGNDPAFDPGSVLNNTFRVRNLFAEGGMGRLHLANHERLPGMFVVKTPHAGMPAGAEIEQRLHQEASVLAGLNHPNIVRMFDFNRTPSGSPYLVMEFLDGCDLNEIRSSRVLRPWHVAAIVRQIASGLMATHARGVVHRDLKPENVFIVPVSGEDDVVKLIDFGASKVLRSTRLSLNNGPELIGTPSYMSPEQTRGTEGVDGRTDQFALAVLTYEMLTGRAPFAAGDPITTLYRIANDALPPLAPLLTWNPKAVEPVLRRALEKDPDARYPTVREFSQALDRAMDQDIGGPRESLQLFNNRTARYPVASDHGGHVTGGGGSHCAKYSAERAPAPWMPNSRAGRASSSSLTVRTNRVRRAGPRRRRRRLLFVACMVAVGTLLFRPPAPQVGPVLARWQADLGGRVQALLAHTLIRGPRSAAANSDVLQPLFSDSDSAQRVPP